MRHRPWPVVAPAADWLAERIDRHRRVLDRHSLRGGPAERDACAISANGKSACSPQSASVRRSRRSTGREVRPSRCCPPTRRPTERSNVWRGSASASRHVSSWSDGRRCSSSRCGPNSTSDGRAFSPLSRRDGRWLAWLVRRSGGACGRSTAASAWSIPPDTAALVSWWSGSSMVVVRSSSAAGESLSSPRGHSSTSTSIWRSGGVVRK